MLKIRKSFTLYSNLKRNKKMSVSSMTVGGKIKFKVVLLGDQHVGKSSIIDRFINDKFQDSYNATIGIDFLVRNISHDNKTYRLQLWDTAGQQRFRSLIPGYLKDSHCALIVYDISDPKSLESTARWLDFYNEHKEPHSIGILVGNKSDLTGQENGCSITEIQNQAKKLKVQSYDISAKTGKGVNELFIKVIEHVNQSLKKQTLKLVQQKVEQDFGTASVVVARDQPNIKLEKGGEATHEIHSMKGPCC